MRASPRGPAARRVVIFLVATLALAFHNLLAPLASVPPASDPAICVQQDGAPQDEPAGEHGSGHDFCCIIACVACGVAYVASVAGILDFPERSGTRRVSARATRILASRPLEVFFAARGPPIDLS
jgi:hypothetical protein